MENLYFVETRFLKPKNKLEKRLQEVFSKLDHSVIYTWDVKGLQGIYESILRERNQATATGYMVSVDDESKNIYINMGSGIQLNLTKIRGVVKLEL